MKTNTLKFYFILMIVLLSGCTKEGLSQKEIEKYLGGTWQIETQNGIEQTTDALVVLTYDMSSRKEKSTFLTDKITGRPESAHNMLSFTLNGDEITMEGTGADGKECKKIYKITYIDEDRYVIDVQQIIIDGVDINIKATEVYKRVKKDYSTDILGTWSGVTAANPAYGDENHIWEYLPDGNYYYYEKHGDEWEPKASHYCKYVVHGTWLVSYWHNIGEGEVPCAECWNIDYIENGKMKWSRISAAGESSSFQFNRTEK